jgi:hypothetical protein
MPEGAVAVDTVLLDYLPGLAVLEAVEQEMQHQQVREPQEPLILVEVQEDQPEEDQLTVLLAVQES